MPTQQDAFYVLSSKSIDGSDPHLPPDVRLQQDALVEYPSQPNSEDYGVAMVHALLRLALAITRSADHMCSDLMESKPLLRVS
jgi:hypothetical protein